MGVILLKLEGPMQSWGVGSRFIERMTESTPSKSGLIGLICSALGRPRDGSVDDLAEMEMAVRVDREGQITYDFHTTLDVLQADGKNRRTVVSKRYYISDACFLAGLEHDNNTLLKQIINSLKTPRWPPFLGRKSFPASSPICLTNKALQEPLMKIIKHYPWQGRPQDNPPNFLRLVYECGSNEGEPRLDVPISFRLRRFRSRNVTTEFISFKELEQEE
jgi:CRISPR system Cascade subunit CasD